MAGIMLGGIADGFKAGEELGIKRQEQVRLSEQGRMTLELMQQRQQMAEQRDIMGIADKQISDTMAAVNSLITESIKAGKDPATISKAVQPLIDSAKSLAEKAGRDPGQLDVQARAWMHTPDNTGGKKKVVKIGSDLNGDRYGVLDEHEGTVTPIDDAVKPAKGQPRLSPEETITPRQVAMANIPVQSQTRISEAFSALQPAQAPVPAPATPSVVAPETQKMRSQIDFLAERVLLGDNSVLAGYRGSGQGAAFRMAVQQRSAELAMERGMSPADVNSNVAKFMGEKRGASSLGQRSANISSSLNMAMATLPRVMEASELVDRTSYPDINRIILAAKERTGDEKVVKLGIALQTFIMAYARAQGAGNSMLTDSARHEAQQLLQRAWSHGQIKSGLDQMIIELKAEEEGARNAIQGFSQKYRAGPTATQAAPAPAPAAPSAKPDPLGIR